MRVAVFTSQFPGHVNTYFARDVRALIDAGMDVDVFPLYPLDERHWDAVPDCLAPDILPRGRVHHLHISRRLLGGAMTHPAWLAKTATGLIRTCVTAVPFGTMPIAKTAYAVAAAYAWACTTKAAYDSVLAYWGNYAATSAFVFRRLTSSNGSFSMFLHAGTDLYRDQVFLRAKLREADNVILVCEFNRRFLYELYPDLRPMLERKISIHHLAIDLREFAWTPQRRSSNQLLAVGALEPQKGHHILLDAMAALDETGDPVRLRVIGDGSCRRALEHRAMRLRIGARVTFSGWAMPDEVRRALCDATLLVHSSSGLGDAVPTVIKEALAVGTPVIASDVAGIPELLDGGRCGILVPCGDAAALSHEIARLLRSPSLREQYAHAGRQHAERLFDTRLNGPRLAAIVSRTSCAPASGNRVAVGEILES